MPIPCQPSAFDLAAIQTTGKLVQLLRKPTCVVLTAGTPNATRLYTEAGELPASYSTPPCSVAIPDRAVYRYTSAQGASALETEPAERAAADIRQLYSWTCRQLGLSMGKLSRKVGR